MGTVSDKLTYLSQTKGKIKDMINYSGEKITSETTFRDYSKILFKNYLDILIDKGEALFENLPHVENDTSSDYVTLEDTAKAPMEVSLLPQTSQETTTGKNKFGINYLSNGEATIIDANINDFKLTNKWASTIINNNNTMAMLKPSTTYTASYKYKILSRPDSMGSANQPYILILYGGTHSSYVISDNRKNTGELNTWFEGTNTFTTASDLTNWRILSYTYKDGNNNNAGEIEIKDFQIEEGSTATDFEKFTNGASPNPDYPQEIHCTTGENLIKVTNSDSTEETTYPISLGDKEMFNINNVSDGFVYDESVDKFYINRKNGKTTLDTTGWTRSAYNNIYYFFKAKPTNCKSAVLCLSNYFIYNASYTNVDNSLYVGTNNLIIGRPIVNGSYIEELSDFTNWLGSHNTEIIYQLTTFTLEEITDATLISQLRAIKNALSMQGVTHIISTATGENLPFLIKARAIKNFN